MTAEHPAALDVRSDEGVAPGGDDVTSGSLATSEGVVTSESGMVSRLVAHARTPLHRNGYALVAATFATSALGALYWAIAARGYSSRDVGLNASLVSTMMFITNLASLNFTDVLNRFVPVARGRGTRRLVLGSYAIGVGLAGVAATVFVVGAGLWAPWLNKVLHGPGLGIVYVVATMLWVVFVLQDAVLVGLRKAPYVLAENAGFGVVKILLLVPLAAVAPATGIFLSWTAPLVLVVVVVNVVIFVRLIPRQAASPAQTLPPVNRRDVGRFLVADYVAALAWTAAIAGMPVIVLKAEGASASAYVYLAWTIAYTLYLVSRNLGMSLTTEGALDPMSLATHVRATLRSAVRIIVPLAAALALAAPLVLAVFGHEYAVSATGLTRLLALSAIPAIVPVVYVSAARVQRRLTAMVVVTLVSTLPVLVLVPLLLAPLGIAGVGVAWLVVQSAVAIALLPSMLTAGRWHPESAPAEEAEALGADVAVLDPAGDSLPPPTTRPVPLVLRIAELEPVAEPVADADDPLAPPEPDTEPVVEPEVEPDVEPDVEPVTALDADADAVSGSARDRTPWFVGATLGASVLTWAVALAAMPADPVGRFGLVSGLPSAYFVALALTVVAIAASLRRDRPGWPLAASIGVLVVALHATAAVVYPELRYAWAWRHVGVVDLMSRGHMLLPSTPVLPIYQDWPGFFAAATALTEAGSTGARSFAAWSPLVFEALGAVALAALLGALTDDRRRVGLGVVIFVAANWVGQDYFAPQAFTFLLYLVLLAIVLRCFRRVPEGAAAPARLPAPQRRTVSWVLVVVMVALAISHPLTPIVASVGLLALLAFRQLDRRWPAVLMPVLTIGWLVTGARSYVTDNFEGMVSGFGRLGSNVGSNLADSSHLSSAQQLVSTMGRLVVVLVAVLAVSGVARVARRARFETAPVVLTVAPVLLLLGGAYGGEVIFRVYLFVLPLAAFLAAGLFFPDRRAGLRWWSTVAVAAVVGALLVGFLLAYFGKEAWSRFTPREVRAAERVFDHAPPGSLLVTGTASYPAEFRNAERFTYVSLVAEPARSARAVLDHPVAELTRWLSDPRFSRGYVLITRSQIAEVDETGVLPRGSLQRVRARLVESGRFEVLVEDPDALLLTAAPGTGATP